MSRFLFVTWDGAGNLLPTLALAKRLVRAGHDVRLMGHASIDRRAGNHGWRLRPFVQTIDVDSTAAADEAGGMLRLARDLWCHPSVALDVADELAREPADVVIGDCMLLGALTAAQAAGVPAVALFHGAFTLFRGGPLVDVLSPFLTQLGVPSVASVHDACALGLVASAREFEPPLPVPANVRFAGPLLDGPPLLQAADRRPPDAGREPLVLVSLSTSDQGQAPILCRLIDALSRLPVRAIVTTGPAIDPLALPGARNVNVVRFVPHAQLLTQAALVVTHAGLGTVMTALAHGVPLLAMPFGRDQFFNAARIEAIGAGRTIPPAVDVDSCIRAIEDLLADPAAVEAARRFAVIIDGYRGGAHAMTALARLAPRASAVPQ
jgi:UDP:flavonoid glycosyltransferase YjiC (YdhE family)